MIFSGIPDAQTKLSVSEKVFNAIKIGKSDTSANSLSPLFIYVHPLRRYAGSLQTGVTMAGLLIIFSDVV